MRKKVLWCLGGGFVFIILAIFTSITLSLYSGPRIIDLRYLDKTAYANCKKLLNHPLIKSKDINFFVYYGGDIFPKQYNKINAFSIANFENGKLEFSHIIIFPPAVIKSGCIEMAAAHELGHINLETANESEVDIFTASVVGSKRVVIDCLIKGGESPSSERIAALSDKEDPQ